MPSLILEDSHKGNWQVNVNLEVKELQRWGSLIAVEEHFIPNLQMVVKNLIR